MWCGQMGTDVPFRYYLAGTTVSALSFILLGVYTGKVRVGLACQASTGGPWSSETSRCG